MESSAVSQARFCGEHILIPSAAAHKLLRFAAQICSAVPAVRKGPPQKTCLATDYDPCGLKIAAWLACGGEEFAENVMGLNDFLRE